MPAQDSYRAGIYRMKIRKQPPSVYLLAVAIVMLAVGSVLAVVVAAVRPFVLELDLARALQSLLADSALRLLFIAEQQWPFAVLASGLLVAGALGLRRWSAAGFIALCMSMAYAYFDGLQKLFARPRPTSNFVQVYRTIESYAFPSLHVGLAVVCAGLFSYSAIRAYRARALNEARDAAALIAVLLAALALVALSSVGVVVLGAHWPSDVLGGYLFGSAYTILAILTRRQWMKWRGTDKL